MAGAMPIVVPNGNPILMLMLFRADLNGLYPRVALLSSPFL